MQAVMDSMSPEQRQQLQQMVDQLIGDDRLRVDLAELAMNLEAASPSMGERRTRFKLSGDEPLSLAEEKQFPVLWHVGDPPEFWSEHTVPLWAKQRGWWYPPGTPTILADPYDDPQWRRLTAPRGPIGRRRQPSSSCCGWWRSSPSAAGSRRCWTGCAS